MINIVKVGCISIANNLPFTLVSGPCQIETLDHALYTASKIKEVTDRLNIPFIYKIQNLSSSIFVDFYPLDFIIFQGLKDFSQFI